MRLIGHSMGLRVKLAGGEFTQLGRKVIRKSNLRQIIESLAEELDINLAKGQGSKGLPAEDRLPVYFELGVWPILCFFRCLAIGLNPDVKFIRKRNSKQQRVIALAYKDTLTSALIGQGHEAAAAKYKANDMFNLDHLSILSTHLSAHLQVFDLEGTLLREAFPDGDTPDPPSLSLCYDNCHYSLITKLHAFTTMYACTLNPNCAYSSPIKGNVARHEEKKICLHCRHCDVAFSDLLSGFSPTPTHGGSHGTLRARALLIPLISHTDKNVVSSLSSRVGVCVMSRVTYPEEAAVGTPDLRPPTLRYTRSSLGIWIASSGT
eukprot:CAMPEP_0175129030 /NCGR_PEP_ID=MMETSP0087-20121206/5248_1 /TAXON_ID=136419 /ORGANISM="Unknown Unknown, Strain D1" /LENGTH=319 /DNA_ID=CAMNT_0016411139 /DNA_START=553 /DNA_END=1508 /DNA_ORIENTATION=+